MKKTLLTLLLITILFSCKKDDDDQTPIEQLPAATQVGANTAGCLVNGQVFLPKGSSQFGPTLSCFYQQLEDGYHFGLAITEKGSNENRTVNISLNPEELLEGNTYSLTSIIIGEFNYISNFAEFRISSNTNATIRYITTDNYIGELTVNRLDTQQRIISGTFWFNAKRAEEIIEVREGRFDMRYIN